VSPLWNDRLKIFISPERINLRKLGRGLKPRLLAQHDEVIETRDLASTQTSSQVALVDRLNPLLGQPEWQNAAVDVVLSNRLVHYAVIPLGEQLKKYPEQEAYARHVLGKTYGAAAEHWELRIQRGLAGAPSLVSAVDRTLLESLRQVCTAHKLKLRSVTPHLIQVMQVFNRQAKDPRMKPAWLVSHEPDYSLLVLLQEDKIASVNGVSHDSIGELPILLDRGNLASTLPESCKSVYLYLPGGKELPKISQGEYQITLLNGDTQESISGFAEGLYGLGNRLKQQLELDYQQPVDRPSRRAGWALLVTGMVLLLDMGITYDRLHNDRAAMDREIRTSGIRLQDKGRLSSTAQFTDKDFADADQVIGRLSTPWDMFFTGLESVSTKKVAILSVVPDMQTGLLRIEGEAKDYPAVLTLIAQLRSTKPFSDVYLINQDIKRDDPQHPFIFALSLRWVKPT
jgi:hypothetical protein